VPNYRRAHVPGGTFFFTVTLLRGERGIWQRRFWEHQIRDERDFGAHAEYIHFNPVKHGHVAAPHSSFRRFVAAGVYHDDWAAGSQVKAMERE
jgi:REP-associated tyrosine transposase